MPTFHLSEGAGAPAVVEGIDGISKTVNPGESVETYHWLTGDQWTKTSDEPYYNLAKAEYVVEAAEAGWQEQEVDVTAGVLVVRTDVEVSVHANAQAAGGYTLAAGTERQIANPGAIAKLCLNFAGAGKVTISELEG